MAQAEDVERLTRSLKALDALLDSPGVRAAFVRMRDEAVEFRDALRELKERKAAMDLHSDAEPVATMKTPTTLYIGIKATFSGRERFPIKGLTEVVPSHDRGVDYYAVKTLDAQMAARLPVGTKGRLILETEDAIKGKTVPPLIFDDPRTFKVVSNIPGGGHKTFTFFLITFAAQPEA